MPDIVVYTTTSCPYCVSAKRLLSTRGHAFREVDLTADTTLRERLSKENGGWRTVPMVFVGTRFVGGYTDLAELDRTGELARLMGSGS